MTGTRVMLGVSGHSHVDPRLAALPERGEGRTAFPAGWALIEHPIHGPILFDCGYGEPARTAMRRGLRRVYRGVLGVCCPAEGDASTLLAQRGIAPGDVRWLVISHFHPDHVGGLRAFPSARFVAHADAWKTMQRGALARLHAQVWRELLPEDFVARLMLLAPDRFTALGGDLAPLGSGVDLFDDGSVVLVDLPGHAHGQIGLATHHDGTRILLVADAFWQHAQLDTPQPLSWLARRLAMHASGDYAATLSRLRQFRDAQPDAWIIASHCARTLERWTHRHPDAVLLASG
ncbi:MBL fold metallo-hydrolase [Cognatilysobacter terrigena]|uniref:MBL fold metallo-hydrolase n=1 Tax=Cognatilysobacter terrigena TaxID=2488749 RepID=UPI00105E0582|nr:MBL fold metallo-hydrolase [Lysobacter terrigena]